MSLSIEEAKAFIEDARKCRENWLSLADRSWSELKKRQKNGRLWSVVPNSTRKRQRYPAWYSIFKIRQPLILSRIGVPIGRDTTQDGNDNIGATAAICLERLAINLAKSFDFFDVLCASRDDFLATCFAQVRGYYEREEVKQRIKEYITPILDPDTGEAVFVDAEGEEILSDDIGQDDEGYFIELEQIVDVENERVFLEHVLYKHCYIDPDVRRWNKVKRIAFEEYYSVPEFKEIFGAKAYLDLANPEEQGGTEDKALLKRQLVRVFEYWDMYTRECYWFAENGSDFIKPRALFTPDDAEYSDDLRTRNGLYDLEKFFPCPDPLMSNQATDEFWPVPEFYQLMEVFEDIHQIFSRMITLTKAIRVRLLFDASIQGLQEALNEAAEGDSFGVSNLSQVLTSSGGSLENCVQYIPIDRCVTTLNQLYNALEQRLNTVYKLTGTSDLLQGLITDPVQRTFGERQMTEKYALNQIAEPQRKMQEFVRGCYQLLCEMALKNFKEASLDQYIMPQTLQPEHQERYRAAISLLKENQKRFRIELETDSTIALNEEFDKQMRIELVNVLTAALEKTATVATTMPGLIVPELHALKYLAQGFRQGKLFQLEFTQAIDNVIQMAEAQPGPFNKEQADNELATRRQMLEEQKSMAEAQLKQFEAQLESYKAQNSVSLDSEKLKLEQWVERLKAQIEMARLDIERAKAGSEMQKSGVEIQNKLADNARLEALAWKDLNTPPQIPAPQMPQVVVVPSAPAAPVIVAPQGPPQTIINAPNPVPQTSIVQPVQEVPVPVAVPTMGPLI